MPSEPVPQVLLRHAEIACEMALGEARGEHGTKAAGSDGELAETHPLSLLIQAYVAQGVSNQ